MLQRTLCKTLQSSSSNGNASFFHDWAIPDGCVSWNFAQIGDLAGTTRIIDGGKSTGCEIPDLSLSLPKVRRAALDPKSTSGPVKQFRTAHFPYSAATYILPSVR